MYYETKGILEKIKGSVICKTVCIHFHDPRGYQWGADDYYVYFRER